MSLSAMERFFSLLALLAAALAVLIVVLRLVPAGRPWLGHLAPAKRWLTTSDRRHRDGGQPLLQRVATLRAVQALLVPAHRDVQHGDRAAGRSDPRRDRHIRWYVVTLTGLGACVSIYHYLLEWYPQLETSTCSLTVPCTAIWYHEFGFVTLSFSALCGFAAILALMLFVPDDDHSTTEPTLLEDTDV